MIGKPYRFVPKVWGSEHWLANGPAYCAKVLRIKPGAWTSIHFHKSKIETLFLAQGQLAVYLDGAPFDPNRELQPVYAMEAGDVLTIQPYQRHAFHAVGTVDAVLFEASTQHFEDDSVRESPSGVAK